MNNERLQKQIPRLYSSRSRTMGSTRAVDAYTPNGIYRYGSFLFCIALLTPHAQLPASANLLTPYGGYFSRNGARACLSYLLTVIFVKRRRRKEKSIVRVRTTDCPTDRQTDRQPKLGMGQNRHHSENNLVVVAVVVVRQCLLYCIKTPEE